MTGLPTGFTVIVTWDPVGNPSDTADISAFVRSGSISRGTSRYDGSIPVRYQAGTCSLVLSNLDARFDPTYTSSPYWDSTNGVTKLIPDRPTVTISAQSTTLFVGYLDGWRCDYTLDGDATCTLTASDGIKVLSTIQIDMLPNGSGANLQSQYAGARINSILDWVGGFGSRAVDFKDPENAMAAITDAYAPAWQMMQDTADAELGEIYFNAAGTIVFEDRASVYGQTRRVTPQATFGDGGGSELSYTGFTLETDDVQIYNDFSITTSDGATGLASDSASMTKFFDRKVITTLLCQDDNPSEGPGTGQRMASFMLSVLKDADARVDSITIVPGKDPSNLWPQALGRLLGDRITVKRRPPGRTSTPIVKDCFIRGIAHTFDAELWTTVFVLQDASRSNVIVFNNSTVGTFNNGKIGF